MAIKESSFSIRRSCEILLLSERRYYRWMRWKEPKKREAWNKLRPEEESAILEAARDERCCDLRSAGLMVHGQGERIRQTRKENLKFARDERLSYYYDSKAAATLKVTIREPELVCNSFVAL